MSEKREVRGTKVLRYGAKRRMSAFADKDIRPICFLSAQADIWRLRPTASQFTAAHLLLAAHLLGGTGAGA